MPKIDWKICAVCGMEFAGDEYFQVEIESSKRVDIGRPSTVLVAMEAKGDEALVRVSHDWYLGGWMTTKAACKPCVAKLPAPWRALFSEPRLEDYVKEERLDDPDDPASGTEVWRTRL